MPISHSICTKILKKGNVYKYFAIHKYSKVYGISQGKSSLMIFKSHANINTKVEIFGVEDNQEK